MPVGFEQPSQTILESIFLPSSGKIKGKAWIVPFVPSLGKSMVRTMNLAHEGDCRTDYQITPIQRLWIGKRFRPPILFGETTGASTWKANWLDFSATGSFTRVEGVTGLPSSRNNASWFSSSQLLGIGSLGFLGQIKRCAERLF